MSEVRLVVAILVPAIFTLILKDFFDLFMTNRYEGKVKQYTIWMLYFLLDTAISMNFKFVGVISMLYSFIILIIFCAVLYREDIKYITLTVLFIICIGAASELIVALGIRAFLNSSQLQQFSLFGSTCSKLIILIIVRIVKLFRVSGIKRLDYMNWLANVSMTAGSLYIVYNLYLLSLNETKLLGSTMSSIIILLLNVICFKMFDKIAADAEINSFVIFIKCIWGYCKSMKILLISESSTEDDIYRMIDQIIKIDKIIETHDISEELSYITDIRYDIIIINYDKVRIRHGDFKMIFDIRCKTQAPLLVILEGCEIRDKLHVLNMKADDYIEKPINIDELEEKMLQLLHKLS